MPLSRSRISRWVRCEGRRLAGVGVVRGADCRCFLASGFGFALAAGPRESGGGGAVRSATASR